MKVFSISLLAVAQTAPPTATLLGTAQDLSSFTFYQRSSVGEFLTFFTKVSPPPPPLPRPRSPAHPRPSPRGRLRTSRRPSRRTTTRPMSLSPPAAPPAALALPVRPLAVHSVADTPQPS